MSTQALPALPVVRSRRCGGNTPAADVGGEFWRGLDPIVLVDTVTGEFPAHRTKVRTAWSDWAWHVFFEVEDVHAWATFRSRSEPLWEEEVVEVFFDPVGDLESYFEIEINPLGTVKDLVLRRTASGWRKDLAWVVEGLQSHLARTDAGWTAELVIPYDALGAVAPRDGATWRANFLRIDRPRGPRTDADLSAWSPTGLRQFHRAERFGFVEFVG